MRSGLYGTACCAAWPTASPRCSAVICHRSSFDDADGGYVEPAGYLCDWHQGSRVRSAPVPGRPPDTVGAGYARLCWDQSCKSWRAGARLEVWLAIRGNRLRWLTSWTVEVPTA